MGHHHARAAVAAGAVVVGVVDRDVHAAKILGAAIGCASLGSDLALALRSSEAVVAHICTPACSHLEIALAVGSAGLHALIEKPIGVNAHDVRSIHDSFEQGHTKRYACPTHQYAFQRSLVAAKTALPRLGTLKRIYFDVCSAGALNGRISPDELIAEVLPHLLSILQRLQPSSQVGALEWRLVRAAEGEWLVSTCLDGALVTMALSAGGRPTRFRTFITGERGSVEIDHFHDFAIFLPGRVSKAQKIAGPFSRSTREFLSAGNNLFTRALRREFAYPGLRRLVGEFYGALRNGSQCPITPQQSIDVAIARDTILALAEDG